MDFGRKIMKKYGWEDGETLGVNKNGLKKALKPELKFNTHGIGYKISDELVNPWWEKVYNSAASNITVKKDKKRTILETLDDSFEISNKKKKTKYKKSDLHHKRFVKVSTLTVNGEEKILKSSSESEDEKDDDAVSSGVLNLTDEELFKACGGRTVHKGARHGVNMNAKLARIKNHEEKMNNLLSK